MVGRIRNRSVKNCIVTSPVIGTSTVRQDHGFNVTYKQVTILSVLFAFNSRQLITAVNLSIVNKAQWL